MAGDFVSQRKENQPDQAVAQMKKYPVYGEEIQMLCFINAGYQGLVSNNILPSLR